MVKCPGEAISEAKIQFRYHVRISWSITPSIFCVDSFLVRDLDDVREPPSKTITIKNITGVPNGARIEVRFKDKDNKKANTCTIHNYTS